MQAVQDLNRTQEYDIRLSVGYTAKLFRLAHYGGDEEELDAAIKIFVDAICGHPGVERIVESWHVIDEPVCRPIPPPPEIDQRVTWGEASLITECFHKHQVANGRNWPFIYVELGPGRSQGAAGTDPNWWKIETGTGWSDRVYDPSNVEKSDVNNITSLPSGIGTDAQKIQKYVDGIGGVGWDPAPTIRPKVILAPDYYAWSANNWAYTVGPPWRKWRQIYDWWSALTVTGYGSVALPFHAVLEGGAQTLAGDPPPPFLKARLPGHIDMHNMVRMVKDYGMQGVAFWGWSTSSNRFDQDIDKKLTKRYWADGTTAPQSYFDMSTDDENWGEAISTEMWRNVPTADPAPPPAEYYTSAVPSTSRLVPNAPHDPPGTVWDTTTQPDGWWIRFDLAESAKVYLKIKDQVTGDVVRILDWGFRENSTRPATTIVLADLYEIAPGRYWNLVSSEAGTEAERRPADGSSSGDLNGTAQFWDGMDYNNQGPLSGKYDIEMYVDGTALPDTVEVEL